MLLIGAVVSATLTFLAARYWRRHDDAKAVRAAELAAAAQAATETQEWQDWQKWREQVNARLAEFVPEDDIAAKNKQLGEEIAENQAKIKAYHDGTESAINALNTRVITLEQHAGNLLQVPTQVQKLNTDYAVLANKVDGLAHSVQGLDRKLDEHFRELMTAVSNLSYTRGQMSTARRRAPETE